MRLIVYSLPDTLYGKSTVNVYMENTQPSAVCQLARVSYQDPQGKKGAETYLFNTGAWLNPTKKLATIPLSVSAHCEPD